MIDALFGYDSNNVAFDIQRAHSAELTIARLRAWIWGTTAVVASLLIGNIAGSFGIDFFHIAWESFKHILW